MGVVSKVSTFSGKRHFDSVSVCCHLNCENTSVHLSCRSLTSNVSEAVSDHFFVLLIMMMKLLCLCVGEAQKTAPEKNMSSDKLSDEKIV